MSLNIKNEDVHAAVRELADALGVSQTSAVEVAVRAKLEGLNDERQRVERERVEREQRIRALVGELQDEFRGIDLQEMMEELYDPETGLPR